MEMKNLVEAKDRAVWRKWLRKNHNKLDEAWLVYYKVNSGHASVTYEESVEEALCFGWVDSIIQRIDEVKHARKFNPRRMDSVWSESNKRRVKRMLAAGRMTSVGLAKVTFDVEEVDLAAPMPKRPPLKIPAQIEQALKEYPEVWTAFKKISPSYRRSYVLWLSAAKKPETFERRLQMLITEVLAGRPLGMH